MDPEASVEEFGDGYRCGGDEVERRDRLTKGSQMGQNGKIQTSFDKALAKKIELHALVYKRCLCGQAQFGWRECPSCGAAAVTEDQGIVAYYHESWLNRVWFRVRKWMGVKVV